MEEKFLHAETIPQKSIQDHLNGDIPNVFIVAFCLKAGISEAEQTSIASQSFDNTHIRGNK
jgi:hypothetical protein